MMEDFLTMVIGMLIIAWIFYEYLRPVEILRQQEEGVLDDTGLVEGTNYLDGDREG